MIILTVSNRELKMKSISGRFNTGIIKVEYGKNECF